MDDIEADKDLQKGIKLYKNEDRLKHMSQQQLDKEIEDMELVGLMEEMNIREPEKESDAIKKED
jgi:hypothetical protein